MRTLKILSVALAVAAVLGVGTARADLGGGSTASPDPFFLIFDEDGNGRVQLNGSGPFLSNPGVVLPSDPTGGVAGPVLQFTLPEIVVTGDQIFNEPGTTVISDVLRFYTSGNTSFMIYYSDVGSAQPADSGFPSTFVNPSTQDETGPEGFNFVSLDFGYPNNNKYLGVSDTPEPSTLAIGSLGALGLVIASRRRRRQ
jgi:hypothetical protein